MTTTTKPSAEITRAAERYLEQYGDPLVMNTYLKVTILVLAVICLALAALVFRSQMALANTHPFIIRINDVGRAETSNIARRKRRTNTTSRAGQSYISAAIASPLSAIRRARFISSMVTCSGQ